jgi:hypothetical protein
MSSSRVKITDELNQFHFEKPKDDLGAPSSAQRRMLVACEWPLH